MANFIEDGQSIQTFVKGIPAKFDDFYCERRPTLPLDRNKTQFTAGKARDAGNPEEIDAAYNGLIASKLTWWNIRDSKGATVEITPANSARLPPDLWDRLVNVVLGFDLGDLAPNAREEEKTKFAAAIAAEKAGLAPGDAQTEAQRKNS